MAVAVKAPATVAPRDDVVRKLLRVALILTLSAISLAILGPLIWTLLTSFKPEVSITSFPQVLLPKHWTLVHYRDIWHRIPFARLFLNTVIFAGGVTFVSLLFDSMTAYALARLDFPGREALFLVILVTMMLPFQVTLIPLFSELTHFGWINTHQGLIVPRATNAFGIFFMRQFFISIPRDLEDAARIDGANEFRIYWQMILPLAVPALLTLGLFHFMYNWNDLLWPLIVTTNSSMQTLPAGLALFMGEHVIEYGLLMAGSMLALLPMVILFLMIQRKFVEGIATTGFK
jgi:multiple sugar transport system permease protein